MFRESLELSLARSVCFYKTAVKLAVRLRLLGGESLGLAALHRGMECAERLGPVAIIDRRAVVLTPMLPVGALRDHTQDGLVAGP
jgi:hypothetical protein